MQIDLLWKLLDSIQTQIKALDAKAQVAIGIDSLLAGFLGAQMVATAEYAANGMPIRYLTFTALGAISLICLAISFVLALQTIQPRLHLKQPKSSFFFCHLVEKYGKDYAKAAAELGSLSDEETKVQIGTQIQTVSIICDIKANRCNKALLATGIALAAYILALLPLVSMAHQFAFGKH